MSAGREAPGAALVRPRPGAAATATLLVGVTLAATLVLALAAPAAADAQPMPVLPPLPGRPLGPLDLAPESSLGVRAEAAVALGLDTPITVLAAQLDADLAFGRHVKAFASFPFVVGHAYGDATVGVGNLMIGALAALDASPGWRLGAGATLGAFATDDGRVGVLPHLELAAYDRARPVVQAFVAARGEDDAGDRFVQALLEDVHGDTAEVPGVRAGVGLRLGTALWLLAQARAARDVERDDVVKGTTILGLDLGVRGRFPERTAQTWCVLAGIAHSDAETSLSAGFEIRTW